MADESSHLQNEPTTFAVEQSDETERGHDAEAARMRRLFAEAQERFAAMDFASAEKRLRMVPSKHRTKDIERLSEIVRGRLEEISRLRAEIARESEKDNWKNLPRKIERLLELQPGDARANELRHELEEREWQAVHGTVPTPLPEPQPEPIEQPSPGLGNTSESVVDDYDADLPVQAVPVEPAPIAGAPHADTPHADKRQPVAEQQYTDEEDEQLEEIWEFADRLERSPPPLPHHARRAVPEDEEIDLIGTQDNSTGIWIAVMVSSLVVLVAVVTTVVVLAAYAD